ncbi:MAG: NTP transferase domain-containing protein [Chloroflexi bacterium]|nr:NTP transferase domain-containing protein [Chloroflexota bacterium]
MRQVVAMVLAGGKGTRMDILCKGKAKPALPFAGRYRVIDFSLSNCIHSGIEDVAVLVDYQRRQVSDYLQGSCFVRASGNKLAILEPRAGSYKGTADAVYQNLDYLRRKCAEALLILAGDHVYRMDYRKMLAFHEQMNADITVGVSPVPIADAHRFGIVTTDHAGRVTGFIEKPHMPMGNLASMGIYIFNTNMILRALVEDASRSHSAHDFGHSIMPAMLNACRVFAYRFNGYWQDIGTVESYYAANMELTREQSSLHLNGSWPLTTIDESGFAEPHLALQAVVKNSLISPGCVIEGLVENSILSPGVRVESLAVVKNSIIMANSVVGRHSVVDHCILDEEVSVGKSCYIGFSADHLPSDRSITVVGRNVTVPPFTAIDRNCKVLPFVGPEDFTTRAVPSGTVVSQLVSSAA